MIGWYDPDSAGSPSFTHNWTEKADYSSATSLHKPFTPVIISRQRVALKNKEIAEQIFNITVEEEQDDEDEDRGINFAGNYDEELDMDDDDEDRFLKN